MLQDLLQIDCTIDKRQRRDSMWFLAKESPMKFIFLPRTRSRKALGLNIGRSQPSGFHLQNKKSMFGLPCFKQFFESGIVGHVELVYRDPLSSGIQCPLDKSQSLKSKPTTTIKRQLKIIKIIISFSMICPFSDKTY